MIDQDKLQELPNASMENDPEEMVAQFVDELYDSGTSEDSDSINGEPIAHEDVMRETDIGMTVFKELDIYDVVDREKGKQVIATRWVIRKKPEQIKAMLVAKQYRTTPSAADVFAATPFVLAIRADLAQMSAAIQHKQTRSACILDAVSAF